MIVTRKKSIPLGWILLAVTPWGAGTFTWAAMGMAFPFSLKKFVENPVEFTFILTLPNYVSLFLWPVCSFLSDRIWTPIGRRKPFIVVSWMGMMVALSLLPLMPNLWTLVAAYMLYSLSNDIGAPLEALKQEIVPPHQRGRGTAAMQWMQNGGYLIFCFIALGRFDDVRYMSGFFLPGEKLIYWSALPILLVTFLVITLGIKEINPQSSLTGQRLSVKSFFVGILDRELWPVYSMIFAYSLMTSSLGPLSNLLYTDQWHYTKQDMGTNAAVGGVINVFLIGILVVVADRLNRMRAYQILITTSLLVQISYYVYVEYVLPDRRPSLIEIILFGETLSVLGLLTAMIYYPLVYDYVTRNKMGTYGAGAGLLNKLISIITLNAIGFFVWGYAIFFQPPAGEAVRVCFQKEMSVENVQNLIHHQAWTYPEGEGPAPATSVYAFPWYATGVVRNQGDCYELRLKDQMGPVLSTQIQTMQEKLTLVLAEKKMLQDQLQIDLLQNKPEAARLISARVVADQSTINQINQAIKPLDIALKTRADDFQKQVVQALSPTLLSEGAQILQARMQDALVIDFPVQQRPTYAMEKDLVELRRLGLGVIDLRSNKLDGYYHISLGVLLSPGVAEKKLVEKVVTAFRQVVARREPALLSSVPIQINKEHRNATILDLKIVEDPLDQNISPVTHLVNGALAWFDAAPQPEQRLTALARSLRLKDETEQVGVFTGDYGEKSISVVAILLPGASKTVLDDQITQRLQSLLGSGLDPNQVAALRAFYDRIVSAASLQNITVERPVFPAAYAPIKYDYMSGYIVIFLMSLVGLAITFIFAYQEKKGLIRKLGVEEAVAM